MRERERERVCSCLAIVSDGEWFLFSWGVWWGGGGIFNRAVFGTIL